MLSPAIAPSAEPALLKSEFIYDSGPYPQIHATTIAETPNGLIAAWFGGKHERNPDVGIWVSRQVDGSWTGSAEVANGVQYRERAHAIETAARTPRPMRWHEIARRKRALKSRYMGSKGVMGPYA